MLKKILNSLIGDNIKTQLMKKSDPLMAIRGEQQPFM